MTQENTALLEALECDRIAAFKLWKWMNLLRADDYRAATMEKSFMAGERDHKENVQSFARHRVAAISSATQSSGAAGVTQADCDAAAAYYESIGELANADRARKPVTPNGGPLSQAFARHRQAFAPTTDSLTADAVKVATVAILDQARNHGADRPYCYEHAEQLAKAVVGGLSVTADAAAVREALGKARSLFERYGKEHRAKADKHRETDRFLLEPYRSANANASDRKAETNEAMVAEIDAALAGSEGGR